MKQLIEKYRKHRIYQYLSRHYTHSYAFMGFGNHSLNNLYPVLEYLGVQLKYVVVASKKSADAINISSGRYRAITDPEIIWPDNEISSIFISISPGQQYEMCRLALKHKKNVFIEKPPCRNLTELEQLIRLEKETQKEVWTGMQRRYAPACEILKKKLCRPQHYTYRYYTGAYPEGSDLLTELFIHPVDMVIYLFGKATLVSLLQSSGTILLQLQHASGVIGSLELSTAYSWQMSGEQMTIVQKDGIFELNNLSELLFKSKPTVIKTIPLEKIFPFTPVTEVLFNQNRFEPLTQHNNLYINGFYGELESFIAGCEGKKKNTNRSGLATLKPTYQLLDEIRKRTNSTL